MKSRPTANPTNRFHDTAVTYDEGDGPPPAQVRLIEDHSRTILAHNDSPDVGFSHSVNPYRGCLHACAYCLDPSTLILMGDGRTRRIADVRIGDEIYGTQQEGRYRYFKRTRVSNHWLTQKLAFRITLENGRELIASGDHRFLTQDGWAYVAPAERPAEPRAHLTRESVLVGGDLLEAVPQLRVRSIEAAGVRELVDITTGTGDFIANGVVSHNCYARPSHEYLDLGAGTDFDTKIVVKPHAAQLLREAFDKPSWRGELVMFSGVTDCYQAVESQLKLTQQCLEVCLEYKNPVGIITKSALIERDLDLLVELHKEAGVHLSVSLAWVDADLARAIEPWAPAPERRFKVIEKFAAAGIPVGVMCAPIMPGLNDDQVVRVLERAKDAGARSAGWVLLRLPGAVAPVFEERIRAAFPLAADKIMHRIRETRGGEKLYDPRWHTRGRGEGVYAQAIAQMFEATTTRLGLNARDDRYLTDLPPTKFARPVKPAAQLSLF